MKWCHFFLHTYLVSQDSVSNLDSDLAKNYIDRSILYEGEGEKPGQTWWISFFSWKFVGISPKALLNKSGSDLTQEFSKNLKKKKQKQEDNLQPKRVWSLKKRSSVAWLASAGSWWFSCRGAAPDWIRSHEHGGQSFKWTKFERVVLESFLFFVSLLAVALSSWYAWFWNNLVELISVSEDWMKYLMN